MVGVVKCDVVHKIFITNQKEYNDCSGVSALVMHAKEVVAGDWERQGSRSHGQRVARPARTLKTNCKRLAVVYRETQTYKRSYINHFNCKTYR